jgi:hypothetical protein
LVRDWQAWARLKVADIVAPFHNRVALDFPVSLGGYRNSRDAVEPVVLHTRSNQVPFATAPWM